ncbi:MAG: SpoIIE family protein phosphatase, partial [Planctomycetota bacterium]|nr:SpoIIE family protein phosphatase [Planctomycetota bacterium]
MPRRRSLRWQLIMPLNAAVVLTLSAFLVWDSASEYRELMERKRDALQAEARTLLPAVRQNHDKPQAIQEYLDRIASHAQAASPGHHVAAKVGDEVYQAASNHEDPPAMLRAMQEGAAGPDKVAVAEDGRIVVGSAEFKPKRNQQGVATTVWVSEHMEDVLGELWQQVFRRVLSLVVLGVMIAIVVNIVIARRVSRPLRAVVDAARRLKAGDFGAQAPASRTEELGFLADEFNAMSAALAMADRERRLQMEKARRIQERLLPSAEAAAGMKVACAYRPANEVGGDYFDIFPREDGRLMLAIADVTGHGVPAAMGAAMLKTLFLAASERTADPERILAEVNKGFANVVLPDDFASMVVAAVDRKAGCLRYAGAGHPASYFLRPGEAMRLLASTGPLLAVPIDEPWLATQVAVRP